MDTRDSQGRGRFFPFIPDQHLFPGKPTKSYWYWTSIYYPVKEVLMNDDQIIMIFSHIFGFILYFSNEAKDVGIWIQIFISIFVVCVGIGLLFRLGSFFSLRRCKVDDSSRLPHLPPETLLRIIRTNWTKTVYSWTSTWHFTWRNSVDWSCRRNNWTVKYRKYHHNFQQISSVEWFCFGNNRRRKNYNCNNQQNW